MISRKMGHPRKSEFPCYPGKMGHMQTSDRSFLVSCDIRIIRTDSDIEIQINPDISNHINPDIKSHIHSDIQKPYKTHIKNQLKIDIENQIEQNQITRTQYKLIRKQFETI